MQDQSKVRITLTSLMLVPIWWVLWAGAGIGILEEYGIRADLRTRCVQVGALLAALLCVGCNIMLIRRRRLAGINSEAPGLDVVKKEHQDFFQARPTWLVWVGLGLLLTIGVPLGVAKLRKSSDTNGMALAASSREATLAPCKAAGMFASAMASKRDQGVSKEEMLRRYQSNEVMDRQTWGRMADMVYEHPERSPESIERAFTSHC